MRKLAPLLMLSALAACSSGSGTAPVASGPRPTASVGVPAPDIMREAGLEGIIGARASALLNTFGEPRIDLIEGDARKLQFAVSDCVVDIFLYPLAAGQEPVATHVEARRRQGGADTDKRRCLEQVARR